MHIQFAVALPLLSVLAGTASAGFHLFDRQMTWKYLDCIDCPRKQTCCSTIFTGRDDVMLVPSNQFNCDSIKNKNYMEGVTSTSNFGAGTVIKGQCGSKSITVYPVKNGAELEIWESGGSKYYGNCYRQSPGKTLTCNDDGGATCRGYEGEPNGGTCKITATDVWVCPVSLC